MSNGQGLKVPPDSFHLQSAAVDGRLPYPPDFDRDPEDPNSGLHACLASPSSAEQVPQLLLANWVLFSILYSFKNLKRLRDKILRSEYIVIF